MLDAGIQMRPALASNADAQQCSKVFSVSGTNHCSKEYCSVCSVGTLWIGFSGGVGVAGFVIPILLL
jgi:hypothetical protein